MTTKRYGAISRASLRTPAPGQFLLASVCIYALLVMSASARASGIGENAVPIAFNIPAQDLNRAMLSFARRADIRVFYDTAKLRGKQSNAIDVVLTPKAALARMLDGTDLVSEFTDEKTVRIFSRSELEAWAQDVRLDTIDVTSDTVQRGYVASRTVSGTKTNTPLVEVPQSISVVTESQMRDQNARSVNEAIRYVSGIMTEPFGRDPRYDQVYIRGFVANGQGDYRDGLKQPSNNFAYFRTEPYGLERIDVIKGPTSILYGQNNPGGLIDRITKKPTERPSHEIMLLGGNYDRYQAAFDLGGPVDKEGKFLYRLTGVLRDSNTENPNVPDDRKFIAPAFTWKPDSDTKFTFLSSYYYDDFGTFRSYAPVIANYVPANVYQTYRNGYYGEPAFDKFHQEQYQVGYQFERRLNDVWTFRQNLRFGHVDAAFNYSNLITFLTLAPTYIMSRSVRSSREYLDSLTVDNQAEAKFNLGPTSHTLLVGLDYQKTSWDQIVRSGTISPISLTNPAYGTSVPSLPIIDSQEQESRQTGVYLQDQIKILDKWIVTAGVRRDYAHRETLNRLTTARTEQGDSAYTGRLGLNYLFDSGLAPYVSWSTSFLPASGTDFFGQPFKPTTGRQYEGGIKYQPNNFDGLFTLALYELTQQNVLTADPDPAHIAIMPSAKVQTGEVRSRGVEFEARANLNRNLKLIGSVSSQDVRVTSDNNPTLVGKVPVLIPSFTASAWFDYTIRGGVFDGLGFGAGVRYVGQTYADATNVITNDALTLVDAALHFERGQWRVAVNASNLFDKKYDTCSSGTCYFGSRRQVMASVAYRW